MSARTKVTKLEILTAKRAKAVRAQEAADAAWLDEILCQVAERYSKVDIAARAGISRSRLYQILDEQSARR